MKILVLAPFAFFQPSGSSFNTSFRVQALADAGNQVDVLCYPHGEPFQQENIKIIRCFKKRVFKTLQPGELLKKIVYDFLMFFSFFRLVFIGDYQVVFAHASAFYWALALKPFVKAKFVATLHGNVENEFEKWNISKNLFLKSIFANLEKLVVRLYDRSIVVSKGVKDLLVKRGADTSKIWVIPNTVNSKSPYYTGQQSNPFLILYTGTFVKVQNLNLLYETADILKEQNVEFILIGGIKKELEHEQKIIHAKQINHMVKLKPRVPNGVLEEFYEKANVVVSPRVFGNEVPMKLYDYLNYGKCILATKTQVHLSILSPDNAVLVEPDAKLWATKILELKSNPALIENFGKAAKSLFMKNFGYEKMKNRYTDLIDQLVRKF